VAGKLIGVLALQGAFIEHEKKIKQCGAQSRQVRTVEDLQDVEGLIIPGGESTAIGKLMVEHGLDKAIKKKYEQGMSIWGTCAGMILLAAGIKNMHQFSLGLMDISVVRNGFGRQVNSFETELEIKGIGRKTGVFIRAPYIDRAGQEVEVMAEYNNHIVMARQGDKLLATAFHPELTDDLSIHEYFLSLVEKAKSI